MVVLNGAEGVSDMFVKALSPGRAGLGPARRLIGGGAEAETPAASAVDRPLGSSGLRARERA
jgi:hypothetical protein